MKFLVDQQLPRALAAWLRTRGHEALHLRDLALEHAEDRAIWREAMTLGAVIVTKDEDFSDIARRTSGPQVIWVRTGNCTNERLLERFEAMLALIESELRAGTVLIELR